MSAIHFNRGIYSSLRKRFDFLILISLIIIKSFSSSFAFVNPLHDIEVDDLSSTSILLKILFHHTSIHRHRYNPPEAISGLHEQCARDEQ